MKVLWFTDTPCMAEDFLNNKQMNGSLLKATEKVMQERVDLSIAFYYNKKISSFRYGKSTYYPIYINNKSFIHKFKARVLHQIEPESDIERFLKIVNEVKPEIIHIHGSEFPFGLIQDLTKIPCVLNILGNISVYKYKFFKGISAYSVFKYSNLKNRIFFSNNLSYHKRFKKQSQREKRILQISKNIIGRTNWDRRVTKILCSNPNYYHSDEILKEVFYDGEWKNNIGETLNLYTTTGNNIYKGIETLIYCAYLLDKKNLNYHWKVGGIHENDDIVNIARRSLNIPVSKNIQFLGWVYDDTIKKSILECDIYLAVSHIENSPNSLCEALLLGAPCIATYAGGTSQFIDDNINGILIQDGDPYSMSGAIIELKENYHRATFLGKNARQNALVRHDRNKIAKDLLNIYSLVKKHSDINI